MYLYTRKTFQIICTLTKTENDSFVNYKWNFYWNSSELISLMYVVNIAKHSESVDIGIAIFFPIGIAIGIAKNFQKYSLADL